MTPEEHREIESEAVRLIRVVYLGEFEPLYQRAVRTTGEYIPQASEEVRNFLNHVAKALEGTDTNAATLDLVRAKKHIEFGKYVTLHAMTVHELSRAEVRVKSLQRWSGGWLRTLNESLTKLRQRWNSLPKIDHLITRKESPPLIVADIEGLTAANTQIGALLTDVQSFLGQLDIKYWEPGLVLSSIKFVFWKIVDWIWDNLLLVIVTGLLIHLIGSALYEMELQEKVKIYIETHSKKSEAPPQKKNGGNNDSGTSAHDTAPPPAAPQVDRGVEPQPTPLGPTPAPSEPTVTPDNDTTKPEPAPPPDTK